MENKLKTAGSGEWGGTGKMGAGELEVWASSYGMNKWQGWRVQRYHNNTVTEGTTRAEHSKVQSCPVTLLYTWNWCNILCQLHLSEKITCLQSLTHKSVPSPESLLCRNSLARQGFKCNFKLEHLTRGTEMLNWRRVRKMAMRQYPETGQGLYNVSFEEDVTSWGNFQNPMSSGGERECRTTYSTWSQSKNVYVSTAVACL